MSYTPGPWEYFEDDEGLIGVKMGDSHDVTWDIEGTCAECFGNMRLTAAAPDLLEACEKALDWINDFGMHSPTRFGGEAELAIKLQKAISKAKGEAL